jgi:hypothetical protein
MKFEADFCILGQIYYHFRIKYPHCFFPSYIPNIFTLSFKPKKQKKCQAPTNLSIPFYFECIYYNYQHQQQPAYINTFEEAFASKANASFHYLEIV